MNIFSRAILASLVVMIPSVGVYPNIEMPTFFPQRVLNIPNPQRLSYDEVINLLEFIESDAFEDQCSLKELDQVNQLLSFLALEGALDHEKMDMQQAVASLFTTNDYYQYAYQVDGDACYFAQPAIFKNGSENVLLCKSWFKKQWDQTRKFVKDHKKEIIIGAIIIVAVTVVVVTAVSLSAAAAAEVAAAGGLAGIAESCNLNEPNQTSDCDSKCQQTEIAPEDPLQSSLEEQITTFKENVAQEQFENILSSNGISIEENGRITGSLFTHQTIDALTVQAAENPALQYELQNLGNSPYHLMPEWAAPDLSPHALTDLAFSTNYSSLCIGNDTDVNTLIYQARGDWALSSGYYNQAIEDFGIAIERSPNNPDLYLGKGLANFELGHYEESISDYNHYVSQTKQPFSVTDFSIGFAKELPKGIYDSGEGMLQFVTDLACNPIQTSEKVYESISTLSSLAKSGEWGTIAEALSPELHQLVSDWDTLSAKEKGELSGYAFGKHGADIFLPAGAAKGIAKGSTALKELGAVCTNLRTAEKLLVLEAAAEGSAAGMNISETIASANRTFTAAEELGITAREMGALKQSGELEQALGRGRDFLAGKPELQASYDLFETAQINLKPHVKKPMPEIEIRELIHQNGVSTFPKPANIPENYVVKITKGGAGMEYVHPTNNHYSVRVMPGKPHSPLPHQQKPYVVQKESGKALDKYGNFVPDDSPAAHIPLNEFIYRGKP